MDNLAREVLKTKLTSLKGTSFQDAMDRIFLIIYEEGNFSRIKQKKDQGSDGILYANTVLAAYAPESYSLNDFKRKTKSDYLSYEKNWLETHDKWLVVTNLEQTSSMYKHIKTLKEDSEIMCIERLLELINEQTWTKKSSIFQALDVPERYLTNDVLAVVVDDLIRLCDNNASFLPYEQPIYTVTKINLNVNEEHRQLFIEEYEEALSLFSTLHHVLQSRNVAGIAAIRDKVRKAYYELSASSFIDKLDLMIKHLSGTKVVDEYYSYHLKVVLVYFFEQCLFGRKTEEEKIL